MIHFDFHPEAKDEFTAAITYYESCEIGLGIDFAIEIQTTINNILSTPNAWPQINGPIRRCQTKRFPYGILYSIEQHSVYILAIMHMHRQPDYWTSRI